MNSPIPSPRPSLWTMVWEDLLAYCQQNGVKNFRAKQLQDWIFNKRVHSVEQMRNLPKSFLTQLETDFDCSLLEIQESVTGNDGATKMLLKTEKSQLIETVILRYPDRTSLCVSSQVGCRLACTFCQTGKLGFFRNLSAKEIISQFIMANALLAEENRKITHVVFMGMGEPLDNYEPVLHTVKLLTSQEAYGLSSRKVTVSTSGIVPKIEQLGVDTNTALAISLHASRDELRTRLMPINRRYPLTRLKEALINYQKASGQKVTFEYLLLKDVNCLQQDAKELVRFVQGLRCKVNLIPFNDHPGADFERPSKAEIDTFQRYLTQRGLVATARYSKGLEVSAACGQLAAKHKEDLNSEPQRKNVIRIKTEKEQTSGSLNN